MNTKPEKMVHLTSIFESEGYDTIMSWPPKIIKLQYGRKGVVICEDKSKSYKTAFFEAFSQNIFARGEGKNIEDAERNAFTSFMKQTICPHEYVPFGYDKSSGKCIHCNNVEPNMFLSDKSCHICHKPHVCFNMGKNSFCIQHFADKKNVDKQPESLFFSKDISYSLSEIAEAGLKHNMFLEDENNNFITFGKLHDQELMLNREIHNKLIQWISLNIEKERMDYFFNKINEVMTFYHKEICELIFSNDSIDLVFNQIIEKIHS